MFPSLLTDRPGLWLLSSAIYLTLAAFMLLIWWHRRNDTNVGLWASSDLLSGAALLLMSQAWLAPLPAAMLGNAGLLATPVLSEWALRRTLGRDTADACRDMLLQCGGAYVIWMTGMLAGLTLPQLGAVMAAGLVWLNARVVALLLGASLPQHALALRLLIAVHALFAALHLLRGLRSMQLAPAALEHDPLLNGALLAAALLMIGRDLGFLCFTHARAEAGLFEAHTALLRRANEDILTGIGSRRHFEATVPLMQAQAQRQHLPLTLLLLDVDHFRAINDRFGYPAGDQILIALAGALRHIGRNGDLCARIGGNEFALLLHDCAADAAGALGKRLTDDIALQVQTPDGTPVSVSIGSTALLPHEALQTAHLRADAARHAARSAKQRRAIARPPPAMDHGSRM
ncbi:GGDEF domain-containing protein [Jeongeupia sp. HS-3]|uniref:GGDEF domain-containing protein n=1 Tax=Jeongeupia sp. HS-3 TaxID=1009682 RepID=UPI0018A52C56|nr:GGDEF domain-containing protein [Jeongeupia sp. HS-3]BCL77016.1 GGDEF domain-containing protein [Jeongeupia sp. HS-3]